MNANIAMVLPIALPIAAGFAAWKMRDRKQRNVLTMAALLAEVLIVGLLCLREGGELTLWNLTADLRVGLRLDGAGKWFALLISAMWACVGLYSFTYMEHDKQDGRFYLFYLLTLGVLQGLSMSANLITLYMFYELMTLLSMPMVLQEKTKEAVAAAIKYLLYSVLGASMALFGIFLFWKYGTTLEFTAGGVLTAESMAGHEELMRAASFLMLLGFGVKAGMFPLHGWLPTAHPVAPAPASAVLSGVITKAGVLGAIRVAFYLAGAEFLRGSWVQYTWMGLALFTVFLGSMMAYREDLFKKRLAYSTVSQVSYVLFGLSTMTHAGVVGAMLHIVFHSAIKNTLFMSAGAVIHQTGKTRVSELRGIGKQMPVVMWCFVIVSAGLIGIPPTAGFISKWYLAGGAIAMEAGALSWLGPVTLLLSAVLTAGYLLSVAIRGFFPGDDFDYAGLEKAEPDWKMLVPMIVLAAAVLLMGMFPGALIRCAGDIASAIL
ncbi:MAG: proton-conducting transporter membrane subunit [Eubacteriales bacterium]|nr:proton-conducting transporter membrane subunit [Eubacteriales bacterium]